MPIGVTFPPTAVSQYAPDGAGIIHLLPLSLRLAQLTETDELPMNRRYFRCIVIKASHAFLIHPSAWKGNSRKFVGTAFSEVHQGKFSNITQLRDVLLR